MALTPGGGRPSGVQPPPPTRTGQPRSSRPTSPRAAFSSILRRGLLIGGLVIIADLGAQAMSQRTASVEDLTAIGNVDDIVNFVLFSILGILVVRDCRLAYAGALAGVFASLIDAIVVAAAASLAPQAGEALPLEEYFVRNLAIGTLFAGVSGVVYAAVQRWSAGNRVR